VGNVNTTNAAELGITGKNDVDFNNVVGASVEESATYKSTLKTVVPAIKISLADNGKVKDERIYLPGPHTVSASGQYRATL
jgi:hypothetical protein